MCPEIQGSHGVTPSLTSLQEARRISAVGPPADSPHFQSILFQESSAPPNTEAPDFFHDLNLDQIVAAITADWPNCDLEPLFHTPLSQPDEVTTTRTKRTEWLDELTAASNQCRRTAVGGSLQP